MDAMILQFPVVRYTKQYKERTTPDYVRLAAAEARKARKARHAQQGEQIDAFAERMEALEELFRGCE